VLAVHLLGRPLGAGQVSETRLTARRLLLLLNRNAATCQEQLVARPSLEPGIHAVRWPAAGDLAAPAPSPDGPGDKG